MTRTFPIVTLATTLLLAAAGCGPAEEEFQFGAADMEAALAGTWEGTLDVSGQQTSLTLSLERVAPQAGPACGNRELSSPQCMTTSSMRFEGVVTTADGRYQDALAQAELMVDGYELQFGFFAMSVGDGSTFDAPFEYPTLQPGDFLGADGTSGTFVLQRPLD